MKRRTLRAVVLTFACLALVFALVACGDEGTTEDTTDTTSGTMETTPEDTTPADTTPADTTPADETPEESTP